ncbi:MAG: IS6 family transposase [Coxiella sp. (in: Bacteria)]|nr:MAG: IS6 family transposase [Coxiella sp. (in: g-proteobacteria)]
MNCPHCTSKSTLALTQDTTLGYLQFRCRQCGKQFNERTGTQFNFIEYPTEVVMIALHYYVRFKVSLDDVVELMAMRGFHLSHQTVHNWPHRFGPELGLKLRKRRYKNVSDKWHVDATYLRIEGRWCYFYRAIDKEGNLVDVYLSDVRNQRAAEDFFKQAAKTTDIYPEQITTDKEPALYGAVGNVFGDYTTHRDNKYMNNGIEQSHRKIKSRYSVMKGFKNSFSALRFCTVFEETQQFFRVKQNNRGTPVSKIKGFYKLLLKTA